ncbi:hypothetical protein [Aliarcobacter butzleri]|uniref:hypothetical protein n=1 Tax=Aliarcobacter butzleri TaxID=28197 RepID=UPI0021B5BFD8|nr:hypothetical protein [Aliarcobacter butzleri]MCT7643842.1 hypothetical protein [Aliarcobacter butzleri]
MSNNTEKEYSFIANVNKIAENLALIKQAKDLFDEETIARLEELSGLNITEIIEDLKKGNYAGARKLDIDLRTNNTSTSSECSYKAATIYLKDGVIVNIPFLNANNTVYEIASHTALYNKLTSAIAEYNATTSKTLVSDFEMDLVDESLGASSTYLRIRDVDGKTTNIKRVTLTYYSGGTPVVLVPEFTFVKTTSSLQVLSSQISEVLALLTNVDQIIALAQKENQLDYLYKNRNITETLYNSNTALQSIYQNLTEILTSKEYAQNALNSKNSAASYLEQITILANKINSISAGQTYTLTAGAVAKVEKNPTTNNFDFWIPQGKAGEKGDSYTVNAIGTMAEKVAYDNAQPLFSFLAVDAEEYEDETTGEIKYRPHLYIKKTSTTADWVDAGLFGRGERGERGYGILSIDFSSSTHPSNQKGKAGEVDTYKITLENGTEFFFEVTNGEIPSLADMNNPQSLEDIVVLENTNKLLINPIKFNSITIHGNGVLKII